MNPEKIQELKSVTEFKVRFSEVDSMRVVWHGNYMLYLEDGREAFGKKYRLEYLDYFAQGFVTPIVHSEMNFKRSLRYGDEAIVETRLVNTPAAKIIFDYTITNKRNGEVVATARTIQVFTSVNGELQLNYPEFYLHWKKQNGLV